MSRNTTLAEPRDAGAVEHERQVPSLGGFNLVALSLEIRRVLRNKRTLWFIVAFPSIFFFIFRQSSSRAAAAGGGSPSASMMAYLLISMAVYGAMVGTTSGGAAVALERSLGWSRQLRLTPLRPTAYVAMKVLTAMSLGGLAIISAFAVGLLSGVQMEPRVWILSGLAAWGCSLVFAAFGLFMGFLLPSENVMQFVGPVLALMAMFGGIFIPIATMPPTMQTVARFTPVYGVGVLARAPLVGGDTGGAVLGVVVWTLVFALGAALLFRRDTARV
ncbi:MAG: ABC transporter permease [Gemmatimonadaceae bacterium]|nr:ABC transporter permease [Gemmatimonadaceae bacterium]